MLKRLKKIARKGLTFLQKKFAKSIDYLYEDSPYNRLITQIDSKEEFENYQEFTHFRKDFEKRLWKHTRSAYVRKDGRLYNFNRFHGNFALREACVDNTGLNSRARLSLDIIRHYFSDAKHIYLAENNTNYHYQLLQQFKGKLTTSVYNPGDPLHQDMTKLTYPDNSFDLCLSFEDLEHIPDYKTAVKELLRITKPGGHVLLSTPIIFENEKTLVRAIINEKGETVHLLPPDYHGDPVNVEGILCFYHFGWDVLDSFKEAGFKSVKMVTGYDIDKLILDTLLFIVAEK